MNAAKEFCYSEQLRQIIRYSYGYIGINIQEKPYSPKDQLRGLICCAIWYHLYNLENVKSTHEGVLLLVKLQAKNLQLF